MAVKITDVAQGSPCGKKRIHSGDTLVKINGREIRDVLDYRFFMPERHLMVELVTGSGRHRTVRIRKEEYEEPGLIFDTYLMDKQRRCANGCIFCFIDQLPSGMRDSLYFKDDDSRLSFLFGNYITLTNLTRDDVDRIIEMHISPVNVSVHTMNPQLRVEMMKNKRAGESLAYLDELAREGIRLNTQLVLCPGINDGEELSYSLRELMRLHPALQSIAAVPVGLTKHRDGLCKLSGYTADEAGAVIDTLDKFNEENASRGIVRIAFAADEFFIKAGREIPNADYYGDWCQLENGVGMWRMLKDEFCQAVDERKKSAATYHRDITAATGAAAYSLVAELAQLAESSFEGLRVSVVKISNKFFGESVTVSGLLTGQDYYNQLCGEKLGGELLIPASSLRHERDMFLDDMTPEELGERLGVRVIAVENDGDALLRAMLGE